MTEYRLEIATYGFFQNLFHTIINGNADQRIKDAVKEWSNEYSEENHNRMFEIATIFNGVRDRIDKEDGGKTFKLKGEQKRRIFELGVEIHNAGGKKAQLACYYIALNYYPSNLSHKMECLQMYWDKAGDWRW